MNPFRSLSLAAALLIPLGCSATQSNWSAPEGHPANPATAAAPLTHSPDHLAAQPEDSSVQPPPAGHDHAAHAHAELAADMHAAHAPQPAAAAPTGHDHSAHAAAEPVVAAAPAGHDHAAHAHAEHSADAEHDADDQTRINQLFASYLQLTASLAADNAEEAGKHLALLHRQGHGLSSAIDERVGDLGDRIGRAAHEEAPTLELMRQRLQAVSPAVIELIAIAPPTDPATPSIREAYCPMVKASWLQTGETIANPYMGRAMLDCGSVTRTYTITPSPATEHVH